MSMSAQQASYNFSITLTSDTAVFETPEFLDLVAKVNAATEEEVTEMLRTAIRGKFTATISAARVVSLDMSKMKPEDLIISEGRCRMLKDPRNYQ